MAQALAGQDAAGAAVTTAGTTSQPTSGNASATFVVPGLALGTLYDVHMVARDLAGNTQPNITSLL